MAKHWKWFGTAAHFIGSYDCHFAMCTQVGSYIVSTVGEYVPASHREKGSRGFQQIGCDRLYETMVFRAGAPCVEPKCKCGLPSLDSDELDMAGYNTRGDAREGHMRLCAKWSTKRARKRA